MPMSSAEVRHRYAIDGRFELRNGMPYARLRLVRLSQNAPHRVARNQQFFVRGNDPSVQFRLLSADAALPADCLLVLIRIQCQTSPLQACADARADFRRMFA